MVCHDTQTKQITSIFDFATTSQTQASISSYLLQAKWLLENHITSKDKFLKEQMSKNKDGCIF